MRAVTAAQERLLRHFCDTPMLLESRGSLIVRRLCVLLGAERVFREMAGILMEEGNLQFAGAPGLAGGRCKVSVLLTPRLARVRQGS